MLLLSVHVFLLWASASDNWQDWQVWPLKLLLRFQVRTGSVALIMEP
jgi:hypothetical protein